MKKDSELFMADFFQSLEKGFEKLEREKIGKLYRPCAEKCAGRFVLEMQKKQFEECGKNLDEQYKKYGNTPYFFAKIIESGHIYEIGYPNCTCPLVLEGISKSPVHCECSRQSVLYVLQQLMPEKIIEVKILETVLSGGKKCRFKVTVE